MNIKMRYVTTRKNKDGSLRYYWQRKGFPLANLPADPAERWRMAENLNRDADGAVLQEVVDGTIGWLIDEYEKTDRYRELAVESRRVYDRWLKVFRQMWGAVPVQGISRRIVVDFAQSLKKKPAVRGQAIAVLSNLCDLAMYFGLATSNPCQKLRLRKPKARDEYWLPADIDKFFEACDGHPRGDAMRLAIKVLLYTGQRPGDALSLSRAAYDGSAIRLRQQKTGTLLKIPVHNELRVELDNLRHNDTRIIPLPGTGTPQYKLFNRAFGEIREKAGLEHLQARDLRRTAVVMLAESGCKVPEIAAVTGHSIERTERIIDVYFVRTKSMAQSAIAKWEAHKPNTKSNVEALKSNVGIEK